MATVELTANSGVTVECSEGDLLWYGSIEDSKPQIIGHLIYTHGMSEGEARAEADAWVLTAATVERV